jgi:hypothetical protein
METSVRMGEPSRSTAPPDTSLLLAHVSVVKWVMLT